MQHDGGVRNFTGVFDNTSTVITDDGCGIQPGRRKPSEGSPKTISQPCYFWAPKRATVGDRRLDVFQRYIQAEFRRDATYLRPLPRDRSRAQGLALRGRTKQGNDSESLSGIIICNGPNVGIDAEDLL
jgi:hypothetical protein